MKFKLPPFFFFHGLGYLFISDFKQAVVLKNDLRKFENQVN